MTPSNPFDFSDFGPAKRPSGPPPVPGPGGAGAPAASSGPAAAGFDPWAGQPSAAAPAAPPSDAFGDPVGPDAFGHGGGRDAFGGLTAGGATLTTAGPPLTWFFLALGLAVAGIVLALVGTLAGGMIVTALTGWLLAGPIAIGALAVYNRIDTRRRTESIYSAPSWTSTLYWAVLAASVIGIALGAWQIALWAGRL